MIFPRSAVLGLIVCLGLKLGFIKRLEEAILSEVFYSDILTSIVKVLRICWQVVQKSWLSCPALGSNDQGCAAKIRPTGEPSIFLTGEFSKTQHPDMFVELKLDRYDVYKLETRTEQSAWIYSQDQFLRMHPRELKIVFSFFQMDLLLVLLLLLVFQIPRNHLHSRWLLLFPRSRCLQTLSSTTWSLSQEIYVQRDAPILISRFKLSSILNAMLLPHTTMRAFFCCGSFWW